MPLSEVAIRKLVGRFGFRSLPPGAIEHIEYPVVVDGKAYREATGFVDKVEALKRFRQLGPAA